MAKPQRRMRLSGVPATLVVGASTNGLTITNVGTRAASWWLSSSPHGIAFAAYAGTLQRGQSVAVAMTATAQGTYRTTLGISGGGISEGSPVVSVATPALTPPPTPPAVAQITVSGPSAMRVGEPAQLSVSWANLETIGVATMVVR